jgi:protocatechuate 3,4-dioxygenase beta subunit
VGLHLLSIVLWPHPLAWRTAKAHLAACELVCDAVSANFVGDVAGYCRTLARVAVEVHTALPVAGIAMARTSAIGRRLNALRARVFDLPLRRRNALAFGAVAILIAVLLGVLQIALAAPPAKPAATTPETKTDSAPKPESPSETSSKETSEPNPQSMRVRVLDPENNPAADADVHASVWTNEKGFRHNRDYKTDAKGVAVVELPTTRDIVRLWVGKKPFVTMFSHWEQNELASGTPLPSEYTVRLERGVTAGGRIVDEQGKPIVGAMVEVMKDGGKPTKGDDRTEYQTWLASKGSDMPQEGGAATTDADGRWRIERIPDNDSVTLRLKVSHPDYASDTAWGQLQDEAGITTESLRHETATLTLPKTRGVVIQGRITDHEGKPIKDAKVMQITNAVMGVVGGSVHKADSSPSSTDASNGVRSETTGRPCSRLGGTTSKDRRKTRYAIPGFPHGTGQADRTAVC